MDELNEYLECTCVRCDDGYFQDTNYDYFDYGKDINEGNKNNTNFYLSSR